MPMIRLIATDMDATLLDDKSEVTPRTARAVTRAMEAGARFVIASGRMYETARPYAELLNANAPMIAFNGAMACDWRTGAPLFKTTIPAETAREVCAMAEARGVFIQYFPERGLFYARRDPAVSDEYESRVALSRHRDRAAALRVDQGRAAQIALSGQARAARWPCARRSAKPFPA